MTSPSADRPTRSQIAAARLLVEMLAADRQPVDGSLWLIAGLPLVAREVPR